MHAVYLLINQTTGRIYIGQTAKPADRLKQHRHNYRETELGNDLAVQPFDFRVRWYPDRAAARMAESAWIDRARTAGLSLYNRKAEATLRPDLLR